MLTSSPFAKGRALSMVDIHCRGCGVHLGVATEPVRMYCDDICLTELPGINANEFRDSVISAVFAHKPGTSKIELARIFGMARQRIEQVLKIRDYQ